ncbi:MAG: AMIN domain-containing protein [Candidatus Abyssobacteria bacterium SURF_17]|uniref:AMIN domain-containing protein n=1 Tax=Candidatus Abyssobacteria bacterium SURF_17 TaxID=2093361 RepID=A0A419ENA0_9BACT|nr:MAG: AMIN domain-containing protein [Candidatus Abyssubacteria bacterium SURF_17]
MGSLVSDSRYRIVLAAVAVVLLVGLLSPCTFAGTSLEQRKVHYLERLGLDGSDPAVVKTAQESCTLHSVDVTPSGENIDVVLQLSGVPAYESYFYKKDNRLVIDLRDTINLSPSPVFALGEDDPIKKVCNSQYRVSPSVIARVVLYLNDSTAPDIKNEGDNLVISVPFSKTKTVNQTAEPSETEAPVATAEERAIRHEVVPVPAVHVNTHAPEVEFAVARAVVDVGPRAESLPTEDTSAANTETVVMPPAEITQEIVTETETVEVVLQETPAISEIVDAEQEVVSEQSIVAPALEENSPEAEVVEQSAPVEETTESISEDRMMLAALTPQAETVSEPPAAVVAEEPAEEVTQTLAQAETTAYEEAVPAEETQPVQQPEEQMLEVETPTAAPVAVAVEAKPVETPAPMVEALEAPAEEEPEQGLVTTDNLVTLTFRDAELSAVLDILARKGNLNILAGKDVRGTVTVRLVDVPFDVALNSILNVNGYGYIQTGNIIRVLPLSQIGQTIETATETYMLSYASADKAKATLQSFLTPNGKIETDERTNMLIVTDVPNNMKRVRELIPQIDRRVQQVLIEVLIMDSVLADDADLGISWGLMNAEDNSLNTREEEGSAFPDQVNVTLPVGVSALQVTFATLFGDFDLNGFVEAQVENRDSRILANPKILTLNNEKASIEIITEIPYNDVTQTSEGGQLSNITFKEVGTKLDVEPQITHDGHVILRLAPEQNFDTGRVSSGVPIIDTRRAETTLIVGNHQTIVMGGLRLNRAVKSVTKVPLLGDLPGVKYAFRSVGSDKSDIELLVFITVHIVESAPLLAEQRIKFDELGNLPRKPTSTIELVR